MFEVTTTPDSEVNGRDAQLRLLQLLQEPQQQERLSAYLSQELETKIDVTNVKEGSVIVDILVEDKQAVDTLKFLSDTGLLSSMLQIHLITDQFIFQCLADRVDINVELVINFSWDAGMFGFQVLIWPGSPFDN